MLKNACNKIAQTTDFICEKLNTSIQFISVYLLQSISNDAFFNEAITKHNFKNYSPNVRLNF